MKETIRCSLWMDFLNGTSVWGKGGAWHRVFKDVVCFVPWIEKLRRLSEVNVANSLMMNGGMMFCDVVS